MRDNQLLIKVPTILQKQVAIFQMRDYGVKREGFLELSSPCRSDMDPNLVWMLRLMMLRIHQEGRNRFFYSIMWLSGEMREVFQVGLKMAWESQSSRGLSFLTAPKEGTLGNFFSQLAQMWDRRGRESSGIGRVSANTQNGVHIFLTGQVGREEQNTDLMVERKGMKVDGR